MSLGQVVALLADVHGEHGVLRRALELCRREGVETIALLGDLFDRVDQADRCALLLADWPVIGVYGNHERATMLATLATGAPRSLLRDETVRLLSSLRDRLVIGDTCLIHEAPGAEWVHDITLSRVSGGAPGVSSNGHPRVTFAGHTHYRQARDDRGPLDLSRGLLRLDPRRRYLINPGALVAGQFAVWHRELGVVVFREVGSVRGIGVL